jgi:phospholipase C
MAKLMRYARAILFILTSFTSVVFAESTKTETPIKHLIVIYQENRTFDHYFGTYPNAMNKKGEHRFTPRENTAPINGLTLALVSHNQNLPQPFRLSPSNVNNTSDPGHKYTVLQQAGDTGLMDQFVQTTGANCNPQSIVMGYYDGNTVTALWNYAQYFSMSDNFHTTNVGQSTVGALNLISGQVHGCIPSSLTSGSTPLVVQGTLINDTDPTFDNWSGSPTVQLTGVNVGNLLNNKGITWGWFQGGFSNQTAQHAGNGGILYTDYIPHHNPFQYYPSTSNPNHLPPTYSKHVGKTDQANHNYDISDFWAAAEHGVVPSVCFFKAPAYQDGHGGYSNPHLEQQFLVSTINKLQKLPQWKDMAIIIAYDDSGGWYDHEPLPLINDSQISADAYTSSGACGNSTPWGGYQGRPAYGLRVPFIIISPWARENFIDHTMIDQTSILSFIEYNWKLGRIGDFSFDTAAGSILNMFDFHKRNARSLILSHKTGKIRYIKR